jgi:predicted alpha/beta-fold hydrolase
MQEFRTPRLLRNPDLQTLAAAFWHRRFPALGSAIPREFEVEPGSRILGQCHWQAEPRLHPTLVLIHGLEGSSDSGYMMGSAEVAWRAGFNVVRLNQRNCGGTARLTPTLYNSSLSGDVRAVVEELIARDGLPEIFAAGFSMGGNLVLKMAGGFGANPPSELRAVGGISPAIDLAAAVDAMEQPRNRIYQLYFVQKLKRRFRLKVRLYPQLYRTGGLARVRTIREFDDAITAPYCGFASAADYYARASSGPLLEFISLPALLLTAQDDPMIPFAAFADPAVRNNHQIVLNAPRHGGHCAFVSASVGQRFWAESRIVEFCRAHSVLATAAPERGHSERAARSRDEESAFAFRTKKEESP